MKLACRLRPIAGMALMRGSLGSQAFGCAIDRMRPCSQTAGPNMDRLFENWLRPVLARNAESSVRFHPSTHAHMNARGNAMIATLLAVTLPALLQNE